MSAIPGPNVRKCAGPSVQATACNKFAVGQAAACTEFRSGVAPTGDSHEVGQLSMGRAVPGNATAFLAPPTGELLSEAKLRGDTMPYATSAVTVWFFIPSPSRLAPCHLPRGGEARRRSVPLTENAPPQKRYRAVPNGVTIPSQPKATLPSPWGKVPSVTRRKRGLYQNF